MDVLAARVVVVVRTGVAEVVTVSTCSVAAVARVFTTTTAPTTIPSRSAPLLPHRTPRLVPILTHPSTTRRQASLATPASPPLLLLQFLEHHHLLASSGSVRTVSLPPHLPQRRSMPSCNLRSNPHHLPAPRLQVLLHLLGDKIQAGPTASTSTDRCAPLLQPPPTHR